MKKQESGNQDQNRSVDLAAERLAALFIEQARYNRSHKSETVSKTHTYIEQIKLNLRYSWVPVLVEKDLEYYFPMDISTTMKKEYKTPAIYRWNIFKSNPDDGKRLYIGEAATLCPQRLQGYLKPGPTQWTNKRLNDLFQALLKEELKIKLEILKLEYSTIGKTPITQSDLVNKHIRKYIESLLVAHYSGKGYELLNL